MKLFIAAALLATAFAGIVSTAPVAAADCNLGADETICFEGCQGNCGRCVGWVQLSRHGQMLNHTCVPNRIEG